MSSLVKKNEGLENKKKNGGEAYETGVDVRV